MSDEIKLTPEQEQQVLDAFSGEETPSIGDLVRKIFPHVLDADGRSKEGRAIKELIVAKGFKARTSAEYQKLKTLELTDSNKEFIRNNRKQMTTVAMARAIFANPKLSNLNIETISVAQYEKTLEPISKVEGATGPEDVPDCEYSSPKTTAGVLQRVDKYVFDHPIQKDAMTAAHKAGLTALLAYMNTLRFFQQINLYERQTNRDLFESSFVRYCYDKPDLTQEEVDQYIVLSHEAINATNIQTRMEKLQVLLDNSTGNDHDRAHISMSLVEAINTLQNEYNQCINRQQKLLGDLKQKRSDRLAELRSANASILNLVQLWKEEKTRKNMIAIADARKKIVRKAGEELSTASDIIARIFGHKLDELVDG